MIKKMFSKLDCTSHRKGVFLASILAAMSLITACADDADTTVIIAGAEVAGEAMAGMAMAGEAIAGTMVAGETMAGMAVAGETVAGMAVAGEAMAGMAVAGEVMAGEGMPSGLALDQLIPQTAAAMCQGLLGCCNPADQERFFIVFEGNPRYEELVGQLPPAVPFNEDTCVGIIESILTAAPFGEWITQTNAGRVSYDGVVAQRCLDELSQASCGEDFLSRLYDGSCLSYLAPVGGDEQRAMFQRTAGVGEACSPLTDGQGGVIYGTCDPNVAFCCIRREDGTCRPGFQGEVGECLAVSPTGGECTIFPGIQVCATGSECSVEGVCEPPIEYVTVQVGEACAADYSIFGNCEGGYCDVGFTDTCLAYRQDGEMCSFPYECAGGDCVEGQCAQNTFCL